MNCVTFAPKYDLPQCYQLLPRLFVPKKDLQNPVMAIGFFILHPVNLSLLIHSPPGLSLRISPHHSHHVPMLLPSITPSIGLSLRLKTHLTNPFLHIVILIPSGIFSDLDSSTCTELRALAFVCFSFSFFIFFLATCRVLD